MVVDILQEKDGVLVKEKQQEKRLGEVLVSVSAAAEMNYEDVETLSCAENMVNWAVILPVNKEKTIVPGKTNAENRVDNLSPINMAEVSYLLTKSLIIYLTYHACHPIFLQLNKFSLAMTLNRISFHWIFHNFTYIFLFIKSISIMAYGYDLWILTWYLQSVNVYKKQL